MKILFGRHAGKVGTLHQFANDWMTVDIPGEHQGVIVRPDQVQLDSDEHARVIDTPHTGNFWAEWRLNDDGTLTALRPRQSRRTRRTPTTAPYPENRGGDKR